MTDQRQEVFKSCYRGRQSFLHHLAYLRAAKVKAVWLGLGRAGFDAAGKRVFDYGFGAGSFLRSCPADAELWGVETDPVAVEEAAEMLRGRNRGGVRLDVIELERWEEHPFLEREYDCVVCSHVLEHLERPEALLGRLVRCAAQEGVIVAVVPINERVLNEHHAQIFTGEKMKLCAGEAGARMELWVETDHLFDPFQLLFSRDRTGAGRLAALTVSLGLGLLTAGLRPGVWHRLCGGLGRVCGLRPTQGVAVIRRAEA